jgi:hypothetical protein
MRPLVWETGHVAAGARRVGGVWRYWRQCRLFPWTPSAVAIAIGVLGKGVRDPRTLMSRECVGVWDGPLLLRLPA